MIRFSSDPHYFHRNIILPTYCNRPFLSLEGVPNVPLMNKTMLDNWNSVVKETDVTYLLGDFLLGPKILLGPTRAKLNGKVILIRGNHDRSVSAMLAAGFDEVYNSLELDLDGYKLYLSHKPVVSDDGPFDFYLNGHIHERWKKLGKRINVGVDVWNFFPKTLQELIDG
jgi:calcineurin-like phosphoesterase family protein